ncbi:class I SAM-dependent methyltransferase [Oceanicoccus sp. KOV_DT_Chl]|uniref:class I SAM-dependent methyltransferase n=1 Tax=Oceanicoccus sp. KOV_DT_Chl TaxID=1904639 RepID=UPI000C7ADFBE|nr:class I SAM-dependent methyltransferase [Oceanicoccus sp. KOV_DT_Chl]
MSKAYNEMSYVEVAAIYNDINKIPQAAAEDLGRSVAAIIGEGKQILDLGAGAGRISVPIAANTDMIAIDIEHHMQKASRKLAAERKIPITNSVGTILKLPFADNTFDAVITCNVLHQIDCWRCALREAQRVLKPGGQFIIGRDVLDAESIASKLRMASRIMTAGINPDMMPTDAAGPALHEFIKKLGGTIGEETTACEWTEVASGRDILEKMQNRIHNETWSLDTETLTELMAEITPWAEEEFDNLDQPETIQWQFGLMTVTGMA